MTRLWSISGERLEPLPTERLNSEDRLESWLEADIGILSSEILLVGRQVGTAHGGRIDLLGISADGSIAIIELKRDKTPRDIVAQVLDYASWVRRLDTPTVFEIADNYWRARGGSFVAAFEEKFGIAPPEPLNSSHSMIIVASALDPASQRIVEYLSQEHEIGINTAFFTIFRDGERQYLSADWLMDQDEVVERTERKVRAPWTGYLFANCGEGEHRSWEDMRRYGFIAAGQGAKYSKYMQKLREGDLIYAYRSGHGYVGFGRVTSEAVMVRDFLVNDARILDLPLNQPNMNENMADPEMSEYLVGVDWLKTVSVSDAKTFKGAFAIPSVVCKLTQPETLEFLAKELGS